MSTDLVELIHVRLREEIARCGLTLAAASRAANEPSSQRLKDVVVGRQKCPADLVAKLMTVGIDALYVLSGERSTVSSTRLAPDEDMLLDGYRALTMSERKKMLAKMLVGNIPDDVGASRKTTSTQSISGSGHRVAGRDFKTKE